MDNRFQEQGRIPPRGRQRPSLQACLTALLLLVLIPTLCAVAIAVWRAGRSYQDSSSKQLLRTASVVARSVESELHVRSHLLAGYTASRQVSAEWPFEGSLGSIRVRSDSTGIHGEPGTFAGVPAAGAITDVAVQAISTNTIAVSNLFRSTINGHEQSPTIAIAIPPREAGRVVDVPTLVATPTELIQALLPEGKPENTLILAVTDGTGHVLARSREAAEFVGKPVPDWKTLRALNKPRGTFEARTIEGPKVIFAFQVIAGTPGWVAVVGEPLNVFTNRWRQPLIILLVAAAATITAASILAMLLARRMLRPIKHLAQHAHAVATGKDLDQTISSEVPPTFVAEFETLRQSLESARKSARIPGSRHGDLDAPARRRPPRPRRRAERG